MHRMGLVLALTALLPAAALGADAAKYQPEMPTLPPESAAMPSGAAITSTGDPDTDAVLATERDYAAHDMAGIAAHEADLRKVLADMPQPFTRTQQEGDTLVYRGDSIVDCLAFAAALHAKRPNAATKFVCRGNPYPAAAFHLGSYLNEVGRPAEALSVLDQGLLAGPNFPLLIAERDASLETLKRWDDIIAATGRGLAIPDLSPLDRALLLRNRGYALTEMNRLDDAQAAYEESLRLQPDNRLAANELAYIAKLKAGEMSSVPGQIFRPNAPGSNGLPDPHKHQP